MVFPTIKTNFMKQIKLTGLLFFVIVAQATAQNVFPPAGNVGIGTNAPAARLHVLNGPSRFGAVKDYAQIDSLGILRFAGKGAFRVLNDQYVFQLNSSSKTGLFYNAAGSSFEYRNSSGNVLASVHTSTGDGLFTGGVKIGNSSLASAGNIRFSGTGFEGYNGSVWVPFGSAGNYWSLTGNAGTDTSVNFIGTTDNMPFVIKVNNTRSGFIGTSLNSSTSFGNGALHSLGGSSNSAFGYYSMHDNTTGSSNTSMGYSALTHNTTGSNNVAVGTSALLYNLQGQSNTAIGNFSLTFNTNGLGNTGIGFKALYADTTGNNNVAVGNNSLSELKLGNGNVAIGSSALETTKGSSSNTAIGVSAMRQNGAGLENAALGAYALYDNTSGDNNTSVGARSMQGNTKGNNNTAVGARTSVANNNLTNATAIGYLATVNASNKVVVGNTAVTVIGGQVNWSVLSDGRFKKNIKQNVPGLEFISKLKPVTYNIDVEKLDTHLGNTISETADKNMRTAATNKIRTGFIAQEVEQTAKEIGYDFDGVNAPQGEKDNYSIAYADFVPSLVKAVQQLAAQNEALQKEIEDLKNIMITSGNAGTAKSVKVSGAALNQNVPNPFHHSTIIEYMVPANVHAAKIIITDMAGTVVYQQNISSGKGKTVFNASSLSTGTYQYSLVMDGKTIETKKMVLQ